MLLLTCPYGLSKILNNEIKKLGFSSTESFDTGLYIDGDLPDAYRLNIRSRIANKVYLRLGKPAVCVDFDQLFDLTGTIDRSAYIGAGQGISVRVHLRKSHIQSSTSAQAIVHKSILSTLTGSKDAHRTIEDDAITHDIFVVISENLCCIYINTSGESLHNRGYRTEAGEAPLKENIAAALVILSRWHFNDSLRDPCCGSGTIPIEAALIARNIAPGLNRYFAFEQFPCFDKTEFDSRRQIAKDASYTSSYTIHGSDKDEEMLAIANANAQRAGVSDTIEFRYHDFLGKESNIATSQISPLSVVTNPPYGQRMDTDVEEIHRKLAYMEVKTMTVISGYEEAKSVLIGPSRKRRNTKNGAKEVVVFMR